MHMHAAQHFGGEGLAALMRFRIGEGFHAHKGGLKPAQINELKNLMQGQIRGVERVDIRRKAKDAIYLDVRVKGSSRDFSQALEDKKIGDLNIDVEEMTKAKVVLSLSK